MCFEMVLTKGFSSDEGAGEAGEAREAGEAGYSLQPGGIGDTGSLRRHRAGPAGVGGQPAAGIKSKFTEASTQQHPAPF